MKGEGPLTWQEQQLTQGYASKMMKMQQILNVPAVGMEEGGLKDPQAVVSWEPEVWEEQGSETGRSDTESVWTFFFFCLIG